MFVDMMGGGGLGGIGGDGYGVLMLGKARREGNLGEEIGLDWTYPPPLYGREFGAPYWRCGLLPKHIFAFLCGCCFCVGLCFVCVCCCRCRVGGVAGEYTDYILVSFDGVIDECQSRPSKAEQLSVLLCLDSSVRQGLYWNQSASPLHRYGTGTPYL